jgi:hypothetical protein
MLNAKKLKAPGIFLFAGITLARVSAGPTNAGEELFPPNAKSGECYARVFVLPVYKTVTKQVMTHEATEKVEIIPAHHETVEENVLTREASFKLEIVPAVYETVTEEMLVAEEVRELQKVAAVYEKTQDRYLDRPNNTILKRGNNPVKPVSNATGEILCRIEVPETFRTVSKTVVKTSPTTRNIVEPAKYQTISRRVVKEPATTRRVEIPAQGETIKVRKMIEPAREKRVPVPAKHKTSPSRSRFPPVTWDGVRFFAKPISTAIASFRSREGSTRWVSIPDRSTASSDHRQWRHWSHSR